MLRRLAVRVSQTWRRRLKLQTSSERKKTALLVPSRKLLNLRSPCESIDCILSLSLLFIDICYWSFCALPNRSEVTFQSCIPKRAQQKGALNVIITRPSCHPWIMYYVLSYSNSPAPLFFSALHQCDWPIKTWSRTGKERSRSLRD